LQTFQLPENSININFPGTKYEFKMGTMNIIKLISIAFLFTILNSCNFTNQPSKKPNIILILIDDLGYGDLGCYGSKSNFTPHIDQLAKEGMKFTDFHSNGPMCTPTRASLLTGMYQNRLGEMFEGPLSGKTQYDKGLPLEAVTIAELLHGAGYQTGMFGKWHLGYQSPFLPTNQGFDEFRGLTAGDGDHHSHIDRWGREDWWKNDSLAMESGYSVDLLTSYSVDFIKRNKDEPFFLYLPHLAIHFPWQGPEDPPHRKKSKTYEDDKWGIIPDRSNVHPHVKAMVESVDQSLGKIMTTLKDLKLDKNTLVVFTSDNGGYIHYNNEFLNISSNGKLRGQKAEVYEGGHRVPFIAWWPEKINAGSSSDQTVMSMDLYPTFAQLANIESYGNQPVDGISLTGLLFENARLPVRTLFWKMDDEVAVRQGPWKLVKPGDFPAELYHLDQDLAESQDLSKQNTQLSKDLWSAYLSWKKEIRQTALKYKN
jgi:arylsulfatase A